MRLWLYDFRASFSLRWEANQITSEAIFILCLPSISNNCDAEENSWESLGLQASILWPPDAKNWLIRQDPDAGKDWKQEEKGTTEDEMVGWHHRLNGHETLGVGNGQGSLACCGSWGHKESDTTEWLNWTELPIIRHRVRSWQYSVRDPTKESVYIYTYIHIYIYSRGIKNVRLLIMINAKKGRAENSDWITVGRAHAVAGLAARNYSHTLFFLAFLHDRGGEANHDFPDSLACSTVLTN